MSPLSSAKYSTASAMASAHPTLSLALAMSLLGVSRLPAQTTYYNFAPTTSFKLEGSISTYTIPASTYTGSNNQAVPGAVIENAIFIPYNAGSGSGNYRRLFKMSGKDVIDGYNRDPGGANIGNTFEAATPNGFNPNLKVGQLQANNGYYQFSLDVNEPGNNPDQYLSLDRLRIYVETTTPLGVDPAPLPKTLADLGNLGTLIYDMDATSDKSILLDYSVAAGSGSDDMTFLIPATLFSGFDSNAFVYLYAEHGAQGTILDGFESNGGGFDEWSVLDSPTESLVPFTRPIPEPSSLALLGVGVMTLLRRRRGGLAERVLGQ